MTNVNEQVTIHVPNIPVIYITDGGPEISAFFNDYDGSDNPFPPIRLASYITRLRTLADQLDRSRILGVGERKMSQG